MVTRGHPGCEHRLRALVQKLRCPYSRPATHACPGVWHRNLGIRREVLRYHVRNGSDWGYGRRNCLRGKARLKEFSPSDEVYLLFWTFLHQRAHHSTSAALRYPSQVYSTGIGYRVLCSV